MRYVSYSTSAFFGPSDTEVATFLKLIRDNPKQKVFVHCYFGDDRTGVMVASYRMAEQHWTSDQAYNEMRFFHFHTLPGSDGALRQRISPRTSLSALHSAPSRAPEPAKIAGT